MRGLSFRAMMDHVTASPTELRAKLSKLEAEVRCALQALSAKDSQIESQRRELVSQKEEAQEVKQLLQNLGSENEGLKQRIKMLEAQQNRYDPWTHYALLKPDLRHCLLNVLSYFEPERLGKAYFFILWAAAEDGVFLLFLNEHRKVLASYCIYTTRPTDNNFQGVGEGVCFHLSNRCLLRMTMLETFNDCGMFCVPDLKWERTIRARQLWVSRTKTITMQAKIPPPSISVHNWSLMQSSLCAISTILTLSPRTWVIVDERLALCFVVENFISYVRYYFCFSSININIRSIPLLATRFYFPSL